MRFIILFIGLFMITDSAAAVESMEDYANRLREDFEANKNVTRGAFSPNPVKTAPKQPAVQPKQPEKPVVQPKQPVVQPKQPVIQPKQPEKHHEAHNDNKRHEHNNHHDKKDYDKHHAPHHAPHHPQPQPAARTSTYVVTTSSVPYVVSGGGVVYEANPHIYSANSYYCTKKNELKYCTDGIGKALSGRVVQNYTDSVAYETYKNGYLHGETSVYTPDGTLLQTTNYSKGLKQGKEKVYFGNGRVHYVANYSRGVLNGEVKQYDLAGALVGEMRYKNGRYTSRYCRNETSNDLLRARIRANEKNVLILCAD